MPPRSRRDRRFPHRPGIREVPQGFLASVTFRTLVVVGVRLSFTRFPYVVSGLRGSNRVAVCLRFQFELGARGDRDADVRGAQPQYHRYGSESDPR